MLSGGRLTTLSFRRAQCGYTIHCGFGKPAHRRSAQGLQAGETRQAADANVPGCRAALWEQWDTSGQDSVCALPPGEVESVTKEKGNNVLQLFDGGGGLGGGGGNQVFFLPRSLMTGRWHVFMCRFLDLVTEELWRIWLSRGMEYCGH